MADTVQVLAESSTTTATGDSGKYLLEAIKAISNALKVADFAQHPGENEEYDTSDTCVYGEVCAFRTADGIQVTGPCRIVGYVVTAATATGPIEVEDGLTAGTGSDKFHIPASTGVGVYHFGGVGIKCLTGAYLNYVGATGTVALIVQLAAGSTIEA